MTSELVKRLLLNGQERARIHEEWKLLEGEIKHQADLEIKNIPGLYALISVTHASVDLYVYEYQDAKILEGGGWCEADPDDTSDFGVPLENGPMPWSDFDAKMHLLGASLGCEVEYSTLKRRTEGGIENLAALRLLHPGKTVTKTAQGEVAYVGWDIGDRWYEVTIDDEEWAFWGVGSHGGGIVRSARKGAPEWLDYEAFRASGG